VDSQAFATHMNQFISNIDGKGTTMQGGLSKNKIPLKAEAIRWLWENRTKDPVEVETEETETETETGNGGTQGGITQEDLNGDDGINIVKGLVKGINPDTNEPYTAEDVIADLEENKFTVSEEIKTLAVLNNAPKTRRINEGTVRDPDWIETEEWTQWATTQLPKWQKAISWLDINHPEPEKLLGKGKPINNPKWNIWNKKYRSYKIEYARVTELLKQTLS